MSEVEPCPARFKLFDGRLDYQPAHHVDPSPVFNQGTFNPMAGAREDCAGLDQGHDLRRAHPKDHVHLWN